MIQGPKLMLPKYGPHDIIAEQTPSEMFFSAGKSQEKKNKKVHVGAGPSRHFGVGGQLTPLTPPGCATAPVDIFPVRESRGAPVTVAPVSEWRVLAAPQAEAEPGALLQRDGDRSAAGLIFLRQL